MIDATIAQEAVDLVKGDRSTAYGGTVSLIASLWSAYLGRTISERDYFMLMALMKVGRMAGADRRDTYVDSIGYILLAESSEA